MLKRLASVARRENYHRADWMTASKRKHGESTIWQRRFWEHQIRNEEDFVRHADYIHFDPVEHGNVKLVREWRHSTFHRFVRNGSYATEWAGDANIGELAYD